MGGKQGRCDGHEVSPVPGGCSKPFWRPRCVRMCERATYRHVAMNPFGKVHCVERFVETKSDTKTFQRNVSQDAMIENVNTYLVSTTVWEGRSCELCIRFHVYRQHPAM